ncbi:MFS transporter [Bacillus spongiae]|uniref:MFS transporter n=1 Tax=Bacillus spongiae TaxID=2683610 RepID=A0ABU8H9N6_9BACI
MAKSFFSSSFFLFLGNWIGIITLNWYVFEQFQNPIYLGWINFARLVPILVLSVYAGKMCDVYSPSFLIKVSNSFSFILTFILTLSVCLVDQLPIWAIIGYAGLRGCISAFETPVRNAALPDMTNNGNKSKVVSYYSLVINICRSIGPAVAGILLGNGFVILSFALQTFCYFFSFLLSLFITIPAKGGLVAKKKVYAFKDVKEYFSMDHTGRELFKSSLIAMVFGFSYTTVLPVLTDFHFPGEAEMFGIAMTIAAMGAIVATLTLPIVLNHVKEDFMCYVSLCFFSISILSVLIPIREILFLSLFSIGLFGQWTRSSNRIYFQNNVPDEKRGRILSVILLDRGLIPLGALLVSFLTSWIGIQLTFVVMGIGTFMSTINWKMFDKSKKKVTQLVNR